MLYRDTDHHRDYPDENENVAWRNAFARDYGRVIHAPSFRRLQGKTQVFPGHESDFFRNRLTHSLEVAQIAEGIAERLNVTDQNLIRLDPEQRISARLCATASLIHDLGHPPFEHNGEKALDTAMQIHGGFEGNAQTLRIVSSLEKKVRSSNDQQTRYGLGLCYRTLSSVLKYDNEIPRSRRENGGIVKRYYDTEASLVNRLKVAVAGTTKLGETKFKTVECYIMDVADDIAYSTFDLEDSLKAGFLTPSGILTSRSRLVIKVAEKVSKELGYSFSARQVIDLFVDLFEPNIASEQDRGDPLTEFDKRYRAYEAIADDNHFRTKLSSELVKKAINSCQLHYNSEFPMLSEVSLSREARERVEVLKQYTFIATIYSSRVKLPEYRGFEVVQGIFRALAGLRGELLMPNDVREQYEAAGGDFDTQMRVVSDFVAGMTDRYAMEFYGKLHSDSAQSMFKPV